MKQQYILRLDDACIKRDISKWDKMEELLDKYDIKPLVGIIPDCKDPDFENYEIDHMFSQRLDRWKEKGWVFALHGCEHRFTTRDGGVNPVNQYSEFAGEPLEIQKDKIRRGVKLLREVGIDPAVFFAPAHTFDENTILALRKESNIRIISDTIANAPYQKYGMTFVPQQSGRVRDLPFRTVTFCYHPNNMTDSDYEELEQFLVKCADRFTVFPVSQVNRRMNLLDRLLKALYFARRR